LRSDVPNKVLLLACSQTHLLWCGYATGSAFLQRSSNSDETFLRGLFARSIARLNRNLLVHDMVNPKRTMQQSGMQQRNASHSTVDIWC